MMKYEDVTEIENGLKAMLEDEEKGITEYEKLAIEAANLGAINTAIAYRDIWKQEKQHAQKLRELIAAAEMARFGKMPREEITTVMEPHRNVRITNPRISIQGDEMVAVSEPHRGGYVKEGNYAGRRNYTGYRGYATVPHRARY